MFYVFLQDDHSIQLAPANSVIATKVDDDWTFNDGGTWVAAFCAANLALAVNGIGALAASPAARPASLTLIQEVV